MKMSFISSLAMQNSMRTTILKAQIEMTDLNTELTTGKHADMGVTLGANTARSIDLNRDVERIASIVSVNSIATQRLSASQLSLKSMMEAANAIQGAVVSTTSAAPPALVAVNETITKAYNNFIGFANSSANGEFLFAGINTDIRPMDDYFAGDSKLKAAYGVELKAYMDGLMPLVSTATNLSKSQVEAFMDHMEKVFSGTQKVSDPPHVGLAPSSDFWTTFGSSASDVNMTSRISQSEVVETSTNSNSKAMRYFAFSAITAMTFMSDKMPADVRETVATRTITNIKVAIDGLNQQASVLGLSEERVKKANEALEAQKKIIETHLLDLEGSDPYEAKTRLNLLQQQIEIAYNLTSRLQKMSLVNYL